MRYTRPASKHASGPPSRAGYAMSHSLLIAAGLAGLMLTSRPASGPPATAWTPEAPAFTTLHAGLDLAEAPAADLPALINTYCVVCHNRVTNTANLGFDTLDLTDPTLRPDVWEKVISKLRTGTMPPGGMPRPDEATYVEVSEYLEGELDRLWAANPNPGRISSIHRLNRTEYNNAIRYLLALEVDVRDLLPGDETADGTFDNLAGTLTISTAHMERYMSVARQLTRMAVGLPPPAPDFKIFRVDELLKQTDLMSEDLPLGSRGGMAMRHHFPADGEYLLKVNLTTNYAEYLKGMGWPQQIDFRLDGELLGRLTSGGEALQYRPAAGSYEGAGQPGFEGDWEWEAYMQGEADDNLEVRTFIEGGPHIVGVSFPMYMFESETLLPQPPLREWGKTLKDDATYMGYQGLNDLMIQGPYQMAGPADNTASRAAIFVCEPQAESEERACATTILTRMARFAYRRTVTPDDVRTLMEFYDQGRREGESFDAGIQFALERALVDPDFLLRVYRDPPSLGDEEQDGQGRERPAANTYPLSDFEVASRLSFFLWSSIPDEELLDVAEQGRLTDPPVLRAQVLRMLADSRAAEALTEGFASQWLNLRVLEDQVADEDLYPSYDHNLLEAMRLEVEMFVASTIEEDRSVLDLLSADYTFVNERLARHYRIPDVYGSRMRRVDLPDLSQRGGLLAQSGLLALTSYPNRTSPVVRGKWLLDNILGAPVPAPPADVDTSLEEGEVDANAPIRERLDQHRQNPVCSTCHSRMDPLGFALENFDAVGAWRERDEKGNPVDNKGNWPSGLEIEGFPGLRAMLLDRGELFARNLTGKLMTYALARRLEYFDQPAIREIVRDASTESYRWSAIVTGIVESPGFLMRASATQ